MRRLSASALAAAVGVAITAAVASGGAGPAAPPGSFAFAIGDGHLDGGSAAVAERLAGFELVVVDGEEASAAEIAALRERGTTVLGYLSVGTIERWRGWYPRLRRYRLSASQHWRDEWFADVSRRALRRQRAGRIAPELLAKGFDGLFLDNVDMIEARRHRDQRQGMRMLTAELAGLAHAGGGLLFAQNGHGILARLGIADSLDGWNREDVSWTYDFERRRYVPTSARQRAEAEDELRDFAARGLVVTATDYTRVGDGAALEESVARACAAGALPFVADIGLSARRLPDPPLRCEG